MRTNAHLQVHTCGTLCVHTCSIRQGLCLSRKVTQEFCGGRVFVSSEVFQRHRESSSHSCAYLSRVLPVYFMLLNTIKRSHESKAKVSALPLCMRSGFTFFDRAEQKQGHSMPLIEWPCFCVWERGRVCIASVSQGQRSRAACQGVSTDGKHYNVPQSSALVFHLWNFDTEMPKVNMPVYLNSPITLRHTSRLRVLHIKCYHFQ